jgi:hypothetical protein
MRLPRLPQDLHLATEVLGQPGPSLDALRVRG